MKYHFRDLLALAGCVFAMAGSLEGQDAPSRLSRENFNQIRSYVLGDESDQLFQKVSWTETVFDGQVKAAKEDKPILMWLYFGGPLGNC